MNINEIKKINLAEWLELNGFKKIKGTLYQNPFRNDKNPSFSVFLNNKNNCWSWSDKATGETGNIIDLICKLRNCSVSEVVKMFNENQFFSFSGAKKTYQKNDVKIPQKKEIEILNIKEITNKALVYYACSERKISYNLIKKYLKEVHYKVGKKQYFSLGFQNISGGFELRNKYSKMNIIKKDITLFKNSQSHRACLFEGFFDYLSALEFFKIDSFRTDVIILNSTALLDRLDLSNYDEINCFFDNDNAGLEAFEVINNRYNNVLNQSHYYKNFNDFNEYLIFL